TKAATPNVRAALVALEAAGVVEFLKGGPGVPANTHRYRLRGACLDSPNKGKQGEQGTLPGVSGVGACSPCPSPVGGQGKEQASARHPTAFVRPAETVRQAPPPADEDEGD